METTATDDLLRSCRERGWDAGVWTDGRTVSGGEPAFVGRVWDGNLNHYSEASDTPSEALAAAMAAAEAKKGA